MPLLVNPSDYISSRNTPPPQTSMDTTNTGAPKLMPQNTEEQTPMTLPYMVEPAPTSVDSTSQFRQLETLPQDIKNRSLRHKMKVLDFTELLSPIPIKRSN